MPSPISQADRCAKEVRANNNMLRYVSCHRPCIEGSKFCKQHDPANVAARVKKSDEAKRVKKSDEAKRVKYRQRNALIAAHFIGTASQDECTSLEVMIDLRRQALIDEAKS